MFTFIKNQLHKIYTVVSSKAGVLFSQKAINTETLTELEKILITADTGVSTTREIIDELKKEYTTGTVQTGMDLRKSLEKKLIALMSKHAYDYSADVFLLVGINGSGKTTTAGKLGYLATQKGKRILFAAADTYRAAATQQLEIWAERCGATLIKGKENQDPASVVFQACNTFKDGAFDILIIDTAGRLQTKVNLMKELEKIKKIVEKVLPDKRVSTLITLDSMLGQNSLEQAKLFYESTKVDGIVMTKLDGTGKGGIVISVAQKLFIPVAYISYGESAHQIAPFDPVLYIQELFS